MVIRITFTKFVKLCCLSDIREVSCEELNHITSWKKNAGEDCCNKYVHKNSQAVKKKMQPMQKKRQHEKVVKSKVAASKFAWIFVIKIFAIILPSQPLLGCHLGFHNFFMLNVCLFRVVMQKAQTGHLWLKLNHNCMLLHILLFFLCSPTWLKKFHIIIIL